MVKLTIRENESGQRLDRFLRKLMRRAPLSRIYRIIRKDLRVNGHRAKEETMLSAGDELTFYMTEEQFAEFTAMPERRTARRRFGIAYEDDQVLIVNKPTGLLTHGDASEKRNTLVNQVCGYLQEQGEYDPSAERTFRPAPVNRLDRNTTGLVVFGKTAASLRALTALFRERDAVSKYYRTIVSGCLTEELVLEEALVKDHGTGNVHAAHGGEAGKSALTIVRPVCSGSRFTLAEVELATGRTHQIRVHLANAGFPLAGDPRYGDPKVNAEVKKLGIHTQLLHACRLSFGSLTGPLEKLSGRTVEAELPDRFRRAGKELIDGAKIE